MIRRPPRSTPLYSSAASDVYKRQPQFSSGVIITVSPSARLTPPWGQGRLRYSLADCRGWPAQPASVAFFDQRKTDRKMRRMQVGRATPGNQLANTAGGPDPREGLAVHWG